MDPSIFLQYSPPSGLPQESKLATYMNRTSSTPTRNLTQALGNLSLESSPTSIKKVLVGEYVPLSYYSAPTNLLPESPQSSPPTVTLAVAPSTPQVHQENVGGTTYFYSTNSDGLNTSGGHNSSASIGKTTNKKDRQKSDDDSGPEEVIVEKPVEPKTDNNIDQKKTIKSDIKKSKNKIYIQSRKQVDKRPKNKVPSTLLQKLLHREIEQERNIVLQCIRHIVKNNYFDK